MSTINEKLARLTEYKEAIKKAIIKKGINIGDNMSTYADAILAITNGFDCKLVIKRRNSAVITEKLFGLDLTKVSDNMGYQYATSQQQTSSVQVEFTIHNLEEVTVRGGKGYKFCIKCHGGEHDGEYLSLLQGSDYKFNLSPDIHFWYTQQDPRIGAYIPIFKTPSGSIEAWKTDTDAVGQKVYANGASNIIAIEFRAI